MCQFRELQIQDIQAGEFYVLGICVGKQTCVPNESLALLPSVARIGCPKVAVTTPDSLN